MPTKTDLKKIAQQSWFVRMAEQYGFVIAPGNHRCKARLMHELMPDIFVSEAVARQYKDIERLDVVADHWGDEPIAMIICQPEYRYSVPVLVNSSSVRGALRLLERVLPNDSEIKSI